MAEHEVLYDVAMRRLDEQMERIDSLDRKGAGALAGATAILVVSINLIDLDRQNFHLVQVLALVVCLLIYVAIMCFASLVLVIEEWSLRPDLLALRDRDRHLDAQTLRLWVAGECIRSLSSNEVRLVRKGRMLGLLLVLLPFQIVTLVLAALAGASQ